MEKLKLIATDIDGTLCDKDHHFDYVRLNNYLEQLHQRNIHFAIASGNSYCHLQKIFEKVPGIDDFIAENGSQIVVHGKTISESIFELPTLRNLIEILTTKFKVNKLYLSGKSASYTIKDDLVDDLYYFNNLKYLDNYSDVDDEIFKININLDQSESPDTLKFLNRNYSQLFHAAASGFGSIDVIPANVNKGTALKTLSEFYDLKPSEVVSFGDNNNDLEMIQFAGVGIAMKNGIDQIKQAANLITDDDNDHDGVLNTVQKLFNL